MASDWCPFFFVAGARRERKISLLVFEGVRALQTSSCVVTGFDMYDFALLVASLKLELIWPAASL
jgi:hypothetical protein